MLTMKRSVLQSLRSSSRILSRRFVSNARSSNYNYSKWIISSSIITIGLASYYLSSPLSLDTDKSKAPNKASNDSIEPTKESIKEATKQEEKSSEPEADDHEHGQAAAYNPETGEINWDCPCLGGMAHGPCGEEFKEAFSCFVYSEAEPKGFDCVEKFKNMQNCFRKYPEIYSEEIRDEDTPVDNLESESSDKPVTAEVVEETIETVSTPIEKSEILDVTIEEIPVESSK